MTPLILLKQSSNLPLVHFDLYEGIIVIGRSTDSDLVLEHPGVSRRHAEIAVEDEGEAVLVKDLASCNGTFIDNVRIQEGTLKQGQRLRLGQVTFLLTTHKQICEDADSDLATDASGAPERAVVSPAALANLSAREREVLYCLLDGMAEKTIAAHLHISTRTVHHHVEAIYSALGVHSRSELAALFNKRSEDEGTLAGT